MRAHVFPGQGIQKKGMGKGLFQEFPELVAQANDVLGYSIERLCLEDPDRLLNRTEHAQPAIYVTTALRHLREQRRDPVRPDFLAGHSLGEYNALLAAGAFDFRTGLQLVQRRAALMARADGGAMAAVVGVPVPVVERALEEHGPTDVTIANYNGPQQCVLSGSKGELKRLRPILEGLEGSQGFVPLRTSGAFHSRQMKPARAEFRAFLDSVAFARLVTPVISNVTAEPYQGDDPRPLLADQLTSPVRWTDSVRYLRRAGVSTFLEIGEGRVLSPLIEKIQAPTLPSAPEPGPLSPLLRAIADRCTARAEQVVQVFHDEDRVEEITGAELLGRVRRLGDALARAIAPQEKALLCFPQGPRFVSALLACWHANVVAVPAPITSAAQFDQKEILLRSIVENSGARYLICDQAFRTEAARLAERHGQTLIDVSSVPDAAGPPGVSRPVDPRDLALVLYTSGSTHQPKGVMLNHATLFDTAAASQWCVSEESRVVSWLPQFHAFGITFGLLTPLVGGALSVVYAPEAFVRSPLSWFELIDRYRATHTGAPNFAFDYCCTSVDEKASSRFSLASLQSLVCGGDVINKQHYDEFARRFARLGLRANVLTPNYGMSECGPISLKRMGDAVKHLFLDKKALEERRVKAGPPGDTTRVVISSGETDGVTRVLVVDPESGEVCPATAVGELWVKSARQAQGYIQDDTATQRTFKAVVKTTGESGFLRTGDLGFVVDGNVYIVGREKEVIVVNGKKYDSVDLELTLAAALDGHPLTVDHVSGARLACAAFSHEVAGRERVVIVQEVDPSPPASEALYAALSDGIVGLVSEKFQLEVSDVLLVAKGSVPVTGSRKIRRRLCKEQFLRGSLPSLWRLDGSGRTSGRPGGVGRDDLVDAIRRQVLLPELGEEAEHLDDQRPLSQLGIDSIRYIRLARKVEEVFGVPFKPGMFQTYPTCRMLADYLRTQHLVEARPRLPRWQDRRDEGVARLLRDCARGALSVESTVQMIKERL